MKIRRHNELRKLTTFMDRFQYLRLKGIVGDVTFGYDRYLNQILYNSKQWKQSRDVVILRDNGLDLGIDRYMINNKIIVHHMNPITMADIELGSDCVFDPEFLICTSPTTHNAIHYSDESLLPRQLIERKRNDTCPWLQYK